MNVCMCMSHFAIWQKSAQRSKSTILQLKKKTKKHADFYKPFPGQMVLNSFFFFLPLFLSFSLILQMCWLCYGEMMVPGIWHALPGIDGWALSALLNFHTSSKALTLHSYIYVTHNFLTQSNGNGEEETKAKK